MFDGEEDDDDEDIVAVERSAREVSADDFILRRIVLFILYSLAYLCKLMLHFVCFASMRVEIVRFGSIKISSLLKCFVLSGEEACRCRLSMQGRIARSKSLCFCRLVLG